MFDAAQRGNRETMGLDMRLDASEDRVEVARRAVRRHGAFALLGASPAPILPMIGLGIDFGLIAVVGASIVVGGLETWRWVRARNELREAKAERTRILEGL